MKPEVDPQLLEEMCELMHLVYEKEAEAQGWSTQQRSRKPWADVPEPNKATMRAAVAALISELRRHDAERVFCESKVLRRKSLHENFTHHTVDVDKSSLIATCQFPGCSFRVDPHEDIQEAAGDTEEVVERPAVSQSLG